MEETIDIEKAISIVEDVVHDRDSLSERDFIAIENLLQEVKRLRSESVRLRFQDIPQLEGTIKGYRDMLEDMQNHTKELENRLVKQIRYSQLLEEDLFRNCDNYVIPKAVVKAKIQEFKDLSKHIRKCDYIEKNIDLERNDYAIAMLQGLLRGGTYKWNMKQQKK